jgi:hypothetical protein
MAPVHFWLIKLPGRTASPSEKRTLVDVDRRGDGLHGASKHRVIFATRRRPPTAPLASPAP